LCNLMSIFEPPFYILDTDLDRRRVYAIGINITP